MLNPKLDLDQNSSHFLNPCYWLAKSANGICFQIKCSLYYSRWKIFYK
jgi:hypothetical protein